MLLQPSLLATIIMLLAQVSCLQPLCCLRMHYMTQCFCSMIADMHLRLRLGLRPDIFLLQTSRLKVQRHCTLAVRVPLHDQLSPPSTFVVLILLWFDCRGSIRLLQLFLDRGANVQGTNDEGWTPLALACRWVAASTYHFAAPNFVLAHLCFSHAQWKNSSAALCFLNTVLLIP